MNKNTAVISKKVFTYENSVSFAKFSGDNNLIHLSNIVGHNSIYGNKIAHGVLVILKFLKITKANNFSSLKVHFKN